MADIWNQTAKISDLVSSAASVAIATCYAPTITAGVIGYGVAKRTLGDNYYFRYVDWAATLGIGYCFSAQLSAELGQPQMADSLSVVAYTVLDRASDKIYKAIIDKVPEKSEDSLFDVTYNAQHLLNTQLLVRSAASLVSPLMSQLIPYTLPLVSPDKKAGEYVTSAAVETTIKAITDPNELQENAKQAFQALRKMIRGPIQETSQAELKIPNATQQITNSTPTKSK